MRDYRDVFEALDSGYAGLTAALNKVKGVKASYDARHDIVRIDTEGDGWYVRRSTEKPGTFDTYATSGPGSQLPHHRGLNADQIALVMKEWASDLRRMKKHAKRMNESASPDIKTLKKNRRALSDEERAAVMKAGAVWHHGGNGEETPGVWKSVVGGKTWYACNTHRAYQVKPTLSAAIKAFEFIKSTA